jgi:hypothetical protein
MTVGVDVAVDEALFGVQSRGDPWERCVTDGDAFRPDNLVPFVREIRITNGTRSVSEVVAECGAHARCDRRSFLDARRAIEHGRDECTDHHAIDARSVLGTVQGSSLRSARAHARPAGLDGACAQIQSWPLRDGRRGDDAKLDRFLTDLDR